MCEYDCIVSQIIYPWEGGARPDPCAPPSFELINWVLGWFLCRFELINWVFFNTKNYIWVGQLIFLWTKLYIFLVIFQFNLNNWIFLIIFLTFSSCVYNTVRYCAQNPTYPRVLIDQLSFLVIFMSIWIDWQNFFFN